MLYFFQKYNTDCVKKQTVLEKKVTKKPDFAC